jgi:hypothetical protein
MRARLLLPSLVVFAVLTPPCRATVVTFDDLFTNRTDFSAFIPSNYQGLNWDVFGVGNGILTPNHFPFLAAGKYYGVVSLSNVATTGGFQAQINSPGTNFNFLSVYLTGAWHSNLNIEVQGFRGGTLLYDQTVVASATNPTLFAFGYTNVDRLSFTSFGGQPAFSTDNGNGFVMDNFTFEFIPEPSVLLLTGAGVAMLCAFHKRKRV